MSMSTISFELPQHPMSEQHEAILSISDTLFTLMNLDELSLDFMPDVIILGDCRYRYSGVEYGRGVYRKEEEEARTLSQVYEPPAYTLEDAIFHEDGYEPWTDEIKPIPYEHVEKKATEYQHDKGCGVSSTSQHEIPVCAVCEALSEKLSSMLDNPPGFDGIKVGNDHFGNKYIDHGWQEAVRRLQSFMAEHGYKS